jgi:hypothetical protein
MRRSEKLEISGVLSSRDEEPRCKVDILERR